jgi:predicted glycoside hydrolase/deacetylase ChbG (UPF0249 family)
VVGRPISDPATIPTLLNEEGEFHYKDFATRLMRRRIDLLELERELLAQVQVVRDMGVRISHLDSHQNQHLYPPYFRVFLRVLARSGVGRMRTHAHFVPAESPRPHADAITMYLKRPSRLVTHGLARAEMWVARRYGIRMADRLMSTTHTGDKAILERWLTLLRNVPDGWSEVFCHPAYPDDELRRWATYVDERRTEIDVLTCAETREEVQRLGIQLRSFHDL